MLKGVCMQMCASNNLNSPTLPHIIYSTVRNLTVSAAWMRGAGRCVFVAAHPRRFFAPVPTNSPVNFESAFRDAMFRYARKTRAAHRLRFYLKHGLANHGDGEREIRAAPFVA